MNAYKLDDFERILDEQGFRYISLVRPDGSIVVNNNQNKISPKIKLEEIKKRLKSPSLNDGVYIIRCKNTLNKGGVYDDFPIMKGNPDTLKETIKPEIPMQQKTVKENPNVTSYSEVLKLQVRIKELEFENERLAKEVADLEEQIEELEEQIESQPAENLSEGEPEEDVLERAGKWFKQTMIMCQPLIDKHFELKEKSLNLEAMKLMHKNGQIPVQQQRPQQPQQPQQTHQTTGVEYADKRIQKFIEAIAIDDLDMYEQLVDIYNGAESMDDFLQKVQSHNEDVFNRMVQFINAKN